MRQRTRKFRKWLAGGAIGLLLLLLLVGAAQFSESPRQVITSATDPVSGLRVRFTLAKQWSSRGNPAVASRTRSVVTLQDQYFDHVAPPGLAGGFSALMSRIRPNTAHWNLTYLRGDPPALHWKPPRLRLLPGNFPAINALSANEKITEQTFLLDGQPATRFSSLERIVQGPNAGEQVVEQGIIVKVRGKPLWIFINGYGTEFNRNEMASELDKIVASFRLEAAGAQNR